MSTRLRAQAEPAARAATRAEDRERAIRPATAHVAYSGHGVCCISPSDDRSALLIDIYDAPDALVVMATAAGAFPEDVRIETVGPLMTISVKQHPGAKPPESSSVRRERYAGSLTRDIELPFAVDARAISTTLERGVLTVRIAKPAT